MPRDSVVFSQLWIPVSTPGIMELAGVFWNIWVSTTYLRTFSGVFQITRGKWVTWPHWSYIWTVIYFPFSKRKFNLLKFFIVAVKTAIFWIYVNIERFDLLVSSFYNNHYPHSATIGRRIMHYLMQTTFNGKNIRRLNLQKLYMSLLK